MIMEIIMIQNVLAVILAMTEMETYPVIAETKISEHSI